MDNEITLEEVARIITSKPMSEGGIAKYMWDDCFIPYIELTRKHLRTENIKMIFVKTEK